MATYKKRGGRPRTKADREAELEKGSTTAGVFKSLDTGASKAEAWIEDNKKLLFGFIGGVAAVLLLYFGYHQYVQKPKEAEAMNELFQAQRYWEEALTASDKDSLYTLSLHGGSGKYGLLDIIDNYKGTDAANLARYYAGMAYLNTSNYKEAIVHLDKFKSKDAVLAPLAKGGIGDAFVQLNQNEDALKYYEEAVNMENNDFTTPRFLFKAAITAMNLNQHQKAFRYFDRIVDEYPESSQAAMAEVYSGREEAMKN